MAMFMYSNFTEELKLIACDFCTFKNEFRPSFYQTGLIYFVSMSIKTYESTHTCMSKHHYKKLYMTLEKEYISLLRFYSTSINDADIQFQILKILRGVTIDIETVSMRQGRIKRINLQEMTDEIKTLENKVRISNFEIRKVKQENAVSKRPLHDELAAAIQQNLELKKAVQSGNNNTDVVNTKDDSSSPYNEIPLLTIKINTDIFNCPIGMEIMIDPVIASDGHNYERTNIVRWLLNSNISPMTGEILVNKNIVENRILKQIIQNN